MNSRPSNLCIHATAAAILLLCLACGQRKPDKIPPRLVLTPVVRPEIARVIPHDSTAFTQGLLFYKGKLYESTGLYGHSSVRILNPLDGSIEKRVSVDTAVFGEGLGVSSDRFVQLTWREHQAIIYRVGDLSRYGWYDLEGEGWGLTFDGSRWILSDGSDTLFFRDTKFRVVKKLPVTLDGAPLKRLNELEFAEGLVFANVWYNDRIYAISPVDGKVKKVVDCAELVRKAGVDSPDKVLNGIAYCPPTGTYYVTGKKWGVMFEVRIP